MKRFFNLARDEKGSSLIYVIFMGAFVTALLVFAPARSGRLSKQIIHQTDKAAELHVSTETSLYFRYPDVCLRVMKDAVAKSGSVIQFKTPTSLFTMIKEKASIGGTPQPADPGLRFQSATLEARPEIIAGSGAHLGIITLQPRASTSEIARTVSQHAVYLVFDAAQVLTSCELTTWYPTQGLTSDDLVCRRLYGTTEPNALYHPGTRLCVSPSGTGLAAAM
jgi:hypothetical protein